MANKYGGGKFNCANCPYSNTSDARDGYIWCYKDKEYVKPTWICCDHPKQ
ncbi:MAG: hypothetical protein ACI4ON_01975 [Clostridia bacterium]